MNDHHHKSGTGNVPVATMPRYGCCPRGKMNHELGDNEASNVEVYGKADGKDELPMATIHYWYEAAFLTSHSNTIILALERLHRRRHLSYE